MIQSYYEQLNDLSALTGVGMLAACKSAGVPTSTYYRWRKGDANPSLKIANKISQAMTGANIDGYSHA